MWFGKMNLKAAALVLVGLASSAFSQAPMDISAEDWNYLSNFKLWGTNGISFGNRPEFYNSKLYNRTTNENDYSKYNGVLPDTLGWVGTARGDLSTGEKGWIDGPIIVGRGPDGKGGSITSSGNPMRLITGPVRTATGNIAVEHRGTTCVGDNQSGNCSYDKVPPIRSDLSVPGLVSGTNLSGSFSVKGRTELNVGSYCPGNDICNIYFDHIDFANDSRLSVVMPDSGRPTRIFVNSLNFGTHPEIVVSYGKGDLKQNEYDGNLLIYVNSDVTFKNIDNVEIMGTIVSTGTIRLVCNIVFAGQFIANKIEVGDEISADKFVFKKFDPKIEISVANNSKNVKESDKWEAIDIVLSEESKSDVTFSYCFDFYSATGVNGVYAGHQDLGAKDASHAFPICGVDSDVKVTIPAGKKKAEGIVFKPLLDGLVETDEALWFQLKNLKGASTTSEYEEKGYKIFIVSNDELPTASSKLTVNVNEDTEYTFTEDIFEFKHSTRTFASVIVTSTPDKGSFLFDGKPLTKKEFTVAELKKLTFQADKNEFGDGYATFKYKVVGSGTGDNTSIEYTATINVIPVNDAPTATDVSFNVSEHPEKNAKVGTITKKTISDVSNEINVDTYTYKIVSGSGDADFTTYFDLASDGTITVKGQPTFDYKKKSSYTVKAIATDDAATEKTKVKGPLSSNQFTITIKIQNENDDPIIAKDQVFSIYEKQQNGKDWPSGTQVCSKYDGTTCKVYAAVEASDPDGDELTFEVVDDVPFGFKKGTNSLIVTDGSLLDYESKTSWKFQIKASDGNGGSATASITVNILDVDEPPVVKQKDAEYSINENSKKGTAATGKLLIVFDNDKVSGDYATLTYTLDGSLTGYRNSTTAKNLKEIFEVVEVGNNKGERTLEIRVKDQSLLDYEALYDSTSKKATYPVTIKIADKKNETTVDTKIAVLDVNESLKATGGKFYVQEHTPSGSYVCVDHVVKDEEKDGETVSVGIECKNYGKVTGDDDDKFNKSFSTLKYTMPPKTDTHYRAASDNFDVDLNDGSIYIADGAPEFKCADGKCPSYEFYVAVSDGEFTDYALVTVMVEDVTEPKIVLHTEGAGSIKENSPSTTTADAFSKEYITDPDQLAQYEALAENDEDIWYMLEKDGSGGLFEISLEDGIITPAVDAELNFEALYPDNKFDITIKAFNRNDKDKSLTIVRSIEVIDVNEAPVAHDTTFKANENWEGGHIIGKVPAWDPDSCSDKKATSACRNGSHTYGFNKLHYSILDATGLPFEINQSSGQIKLKNDAKLSYNDKKKYEFKVKVTDGSVDENNPPLSDTATVTIEVVDVNEPSEFKILADLYEVIENTAVGTKFGDSIVVYDEDAADVSTTTKPVLKITIEDKGTCTAAKNCAEDLFDVVLVKNTDGKHETKFMFVVKKDLDYEAIYEARKSDVFNVELTVTDAGGNKTSQGTKVRVIDENEKPWFKKDSYNFEISESVTKETELGKAEAIDPDTLNPEYGTLYYSLSGEPDVIKLFGIDEKTGDIYVVNNAKLDYEKDSVYKFNAVVTDKKYTVDVPVTIKVKNENERPVFPKVPEFYVDENTLKGTAVTLEDGTKKAVVASDDDCKSKNNGYCKSTAYSLIAAEGAPNDFNAFSIDANGFITVAKDSVLNYEIQKKYVVRVVATDMSTSAKLADSVDVVINVNDVNDAPVFVFNANACEGGKEYCFDVDENKPAGEVVGSVVAKDEDTWSELSFKLSDDVDGSKESELFEISSSGRITTKSVLNHEKKDKYELWVTVTDNGLSKGFKDLSTTTKVTIVVNNGPDDPIIHDDGKASYGVYEVTDENDIKNGSIVKDATDGKDVCYLVEDEDEGQVGKLVAYVTDMGNTDADRLFDAIIKETTGGYNLCLTVKNVSALNYETRAHTHKIKVAVMDADKKTAAVEKTINLVDVNEMPIISGSTTFSFYDQNTNLDNVIGRLYPDDIDTSKVFTDDVFSVVGGDSALFTITEDGKIKAKRTFDFQKDSHTFELKVSLSDRNKTKYPKLTTSTTITITLKNKPKVPEITSKEFSVDENSPEGSSVGQIEATDPDGDGTLLFKLEEESPYVDVSSDGKITVRKGAVIDYEKMKEFTILVSVKDKDGLSSEKEILIKVNDLNEKPSIKEQIFEFPENTPKETVKGPIKADDPDTKEEFNKLEFYPVDTTSVFEIKKTGEIVLKKELDYEKQKSYTIKVRVVDPKGLADTTTVTINVGNIIEKSSVEITRAESRDKVYTNPDTLYVNASEILVEWKQDGTTKSSLDSLKEGKNIIIKKYKDPSKDVEGADTLVVFYSTAAPVVDVDATKTKVTAENIYTVVETVDKKDSSIYVNKKTKEVTVSVKDTVSNYEEKFNVEVVLDTIAIADKTVKTMVDVSKSKPTLDKNPKGTVTETPVNGKKTQVSYTETVNGTKVTVSYDVDDTGKVIKAPVINDKGETVMTEVITVSTTVEVSGKNVVVSYTADANTGKILYGDSEGNLLANAPSSSSKSDSKTDDVDLKTGVGAFTVTYDFKGVDGNKATVAYVIDEKGKIVANDEGDRGFLVTYSYTNKYGNTADKSVFMVLDKLAPIVKILSPSEGDVLYANYVDVDWCIAIDGIEKNCVKQDTLNFQSLEKGVNTIKRIYRDKAGNETVASVNVMLKKAKDVNIQLEKPMIIVSKDSVDKYYALNPPKADQKYAVSILNTTSQKESEVVVGTTSKTSKGSGDEPYPGYDGHIGPTIKIDMKVPLASAVGGLATLDDIIINGDMIPLDGVDAENSKKVTVKEYVKDYCSTEFQEELGKDYSKATLYSTNARVTLWFFTTSGQFVDKYQFDYDVNDPDYVDKTGLVKFFFEMKPDMNGELRDKNGRLYGTGPFIVKSKVEVRSKLRCTVPPVDGKAKFGDVIKSSDEIVTRFGYRRPVLRGNEKAAEKTTKNSKSSSDKKSDSKSTSKK